MSSSSSLALLAGAVLLVCALSLSFSYSATDAVELKSKSSGGMQDEISSLVSAISGSIGSRHSGKKLGPVASLSSSDYSASGIKKAARMIRLAEKQEQVGYLRKGSDLPHMPIQFYEGTDDQGHYTVRGQCEEACLGNSKCKVISHIDPSPC